MTGLLCLLVLAAAAPAHPLASALAAAGRDPARELRVLSEAAEVRWPLVPDELEARIAARFDDLAPATRRTWAADRALPALAGELPVGEALLARMLDEVRPLARGEPTDLAALEQARGHYAKRELAEAAARYDAVTRGSTLWPQALRERAWTLLLLERPMEAMGATVSLAAPWFPPADHAEARLLKATVLLERCRYAEAREAVTPLADAPLEEPSDALALALLRAGGPDPASPWAVAWESPLVRRVREALPSAGVRRASLEARGARLLAAAAREEAAARRELKVRALSVRYEALKAERRLVEAGGKRRRPEAVKPPPLGDDEVAWTFDGTFWRDELGTYRTVPADACPAEQR